MHAQGRHSAKQGLGPVSYQIIAQTSSSINQYLQLPKCMAEKGPGKPVAGVLRALPKHLGLGLPR